MRTDERIAELFPDRGPRPPDTVVADPDAPQQAPPFGQTLGHPENGYFDRELEGQSDG
jgi:hypothetical protein